MHIIHACLGASFMKKEKKVVRKETTVPNYDYLFQPSPAQKRGKGNGFFRKLIKLNFWSLILSTLLLIFQTAPVWAIPICTSNIINLVTKAVNEGGVSALIWRKLLINAVVLAVLIIQNVPATVLRWRVTSKMLRKTSAGIKCSVVRKLQNLPITYHRDVRTGKIQSKFLKDTDSVDSLFHALTFSIIPNILNVIVAVVISLRGNLWVSLFFLLIIPCNVAVTVSFRKKMRRRHRDYRKKTEGMSARLTTMLEMIPVTKAHGLEQKEIETVSESVAELSQSGRKVDNTHSVLGSSVYVVNNLLSVLCLLFCALLAFRGIVEVGDIVLYQSMFSSISGAISGLLSVMPMLSNGFEALASVGEIMCENVEEAEGKKKITLSQGSVCFDGVCYRYPDGEEEVVKNFSLNVRAGECIAVVGSSGSGKSTLMNLINGLLTPTKGRILVDGEDLAECALSFYRQQVSVVPQKSILFSGSLRDNITYGLEGYTEEELERVVEMANLKEFAAELPHGLDTDVGEHGDKLSGGQRQRVTIARALIRNPKILILDEATSALDNVAEYHVQQAISNSIEGRTTFIVAHRLSTIRNADRIVVLENGEAVEIGTYEELMEKQGRFYQLKQMNERKVQTAESALA